MDSASLKLRRVNAIVATGLLLLTSTTIAGGLATQDKDVPDFRHITVSIPADVHIRTGGRPHVTVSAEPAVINKIRVEVKEGQLQIASAGSFNTQQRLKVEISATVLERLESDASGSVVLDGASGKELTVLVRGAGDVMLNRLNLQRLDIDSTASGTVTVTGAVRQQTVRLQGAGTFKAAGLRSDSAMVELSGAGEADVWATTTLRARVQGAGTVRYRGTPQVRQEIAGAGSIEQL